MIKSEKKLKELSFLLSQKNNRGIADAISKLRNEEPFEGAIGLLSSLCDNTEDSIVKTAIKEFMNDIKDQSAASEIITEIRKPLNPSTTCMLISSCWQSGLNYSEYTADFVKIYLKSDYVTALECFTVIEESVHNLSVKTKNELTGIINSYQHSHDNVKAALTAELLSILK